MSADALRLYGTTQPVPEERLLRAGPLSAILTGAELRGISVQGVEVIRGIAFVVRDRGWGTPVPQLSDVQVEEGPDSFTVTFTAVASCEGSELRWQGRIDGSASRGLTYRCHGTPETDFPTARTGFTILHPLEGVVGAPATVEHSGGRLEHARFPDLVDPIQPFLDIRAITHEPLPGLRATCRMEGDAAWEAEDHRNWLDASFKTYFRPLALPWPYTIPAGAVIDQTVRLTFEPSLESLSPVPEPGPLTVVIGDRTGGAMPEIGLACTSDELDAAEAALPHLEGLGVQSLAVRVSAADKDLPGLLRRYGALAAALHAQPRLEIVLPLTHPPAAELDLVATAAASAGFRPVSVAVSPGVDLKSYPPSVDRPPSPPLAELYAAARAASPGLPLGGGMFTFFTELNRRRVPAHLLDFVQHATTSIMHAADDRSVMETLESLPHVIRSVRTFFGDRPYRLGPANIGMVLNANGPSPASNPGLIRRAMAKEDPRAGALFGAAWAAGYFARAASGSLAGVTLMAPGGPFGVAGPDGRRPAFHVVSSFAAAAGASTLASASSDPQRVLACACLKDGRRFAWIANLTATPQTVRLAGLRPSRLMLLEGPEPKEAAPTADDGLTLGPYAVAFIEG
jgi:hypothetical protein